MLRRIGFLLAGLACLSGPLRAETDGLRVLATAGSVEIQRGDAGRWTALDASARLVAGDRIRTGEKSTADFVFDGGFDGMARLGEKSAARIGAASPVRWDLERGKIWILWEYDSDTRGPFILRAADVVDAQIEGGAFVDVKAPRVEIRSFGSVEVVHSGRLEGALEEGFRGRIEGDEAGPAERLGFAEYQDWRLWMTDAYKYKDEALKPR